MNTAQINELISKIALKDAANSMLANEISLLKQENTHLRQHVNEITVLKINLF